MTRVLLVGSGARENAIAKALARASGVELYAAMSARNPGIMRLAKESIVTQTSNPEVISVYAEKNHIELAVIGPEDPLVNGIVDVLSRNAVKCVGPTSRLASLEGDKAFCRHVLTKYQIPGNPEYKVFNDVNSAEAYLKTSGPVAIKPTGLTGGKGVRVTGDDLPTKNHEIAYVREIFSNRIGGGQSVIIEEKLDGEEYSVQAFVDGRHVFVMPLVQDHKRAFENDSGPNTGGMGSYSDSDHCLPFVSHDDLDASVRIMTSVVDSLKLETGEEYHGFLYGQFMLARARNDSEVNPKLIEFNCRLGDPEAMNTLPILSDESNFLEICGGIVDGTLTQKQCSFESKATVCKYLVPSTYPGSAVHELFTVDESAIKRLGAELFYAGVDQTDGELTTIGSRTIAVLGISDTIEAAENCAESATQSVNGPLRHRRDIGTTQLVDRRIEHIRKIRSPLLTARI